MKDYKCKASQICLVLILMIYPLIFSKTYSGILEIKYISFTIIAVTMIYFYVMEKCVFGFYNSCAKAGLSIVDIAMLGFIGVMAVSTILSDYKIEAFTGSCSNNMGLLYYLILVGVYFVVSRMFINKNIIIAALSIGFAATVIFAAIQFMGADIFGLISSINYDLSINYLSTLGNTNIYSSFLCLVTPVFMAGAVLSDDFSKRALFYFMSFVGYIGLFTANTDGGYAGFFTAFVLVLFISVNSKYRITRFLYLCFMYCLSTVVFLLIHKANYENARPLSAITKFMVYGQFTKILIILFAILICLVVKMKSRIVTGYRIRKIIRIIIATFFCLLLVLAILANVNKVFSLGFLDSYFKFTKDWGTGRGYVWNWCFTIFKDGNIIDKIFGFGPGTCGIKLLSAYGNEMRYSLGYYFTTAHNEFLEILLNTGFLGLISYISVMLSTIIRNLKDKDYFHIIFTVGIISYGVQSMFIVLQPVVVPLVFVFFGLANNNKMYDSKRL